jgi:hypothetical protein
VPHSVIASQANAYLRAHAAELFAEARTRVEAWESVRKDHRNRTLALQAQRNLKEIQQ